MDNGFEQLSFRRVQIRGVFSEIMSSKLNNLKKIVLRKNVVTFFSVWHVGDILTVMEIPNGVLNTHEVWFECSRELFFQSNFCFAHFQKIFLSFHKNSQNNNSKFQSSKHPKIQSSENNTNPKIQSSNKKQSKHSNYAYSQPPHPTGHFPKFVLLVLGNWDFGNFGSLFLFGTLFFVICISNHQNTSCVCFPTEEQ